MKKITLFLFTLIIAAGCGEIPDGVVEPAKVDFKVDQISAPYSFQLTDLDSTFVINVGFTDSKDILAVNYNIIEAATGDEIVSSQSMFDDGNLNNSGDATKGDNTFSAIITMSRLFAVGNYSIEFFVRANDDLQTTSKVAVHQFFYDNGQDNVSPVLSELFAPDTVFVQEPKSVILLSVKVTDENGLRDIENVYFITTRPDGTSYQPIEMYDDGDFEVDGDSTASDGRYSRVIEVTPSNTKGPYKFEFQARDKRKKLSNVISHTIQIL